MRRFFAAIFCLGLASVLIVIIRCASLSFAEVTAALTGDPSGFDPSFLAAKRDQANQAAKNTSAASYCGLHAVWRSLYILGVEVQFVDLLNKKYISSKQGSTTDDLIAAINDHGLHSQPMTRCSCFMLSCLDCPAILHVKSNPGGKTYDHWVLYAGTEQGHARIYADDGAVRLMDLQDLAAVWGGDAIVVSRTPVSIVLLQVFSLFPFVFYGIIILGVLLTVRTVGERLRKKLARADPRVEPIGTPLRMRSIMLLLLLPLFCAFIAKYFLSPGYMSSSSAIQAIRFNHLESYLPHYSAATLHQMLTHSERSNFGLIDARLETDYRIGCLPGAINIPPSATLTAVQDTLRDVHKSTLLVVYCQSDGCPYSIRLAEQLLLLGYYNLAVYRGGWVEWSQIYPEGGVVTSH